MKKIALTLAAVALVIFGVGGVAGAGTYPPGGPSVSVTPASVGPGGTVTVTANCTAGESVTISLEGQSASVPCETGDAQSSVAGIATGVVTAPTAPGTYTGSVTGTISGALGSFTVTVLAAAPTPATPTGGLPSTGSGGTSTMTFVAAGLLVVGLGLFGVATVRRRQAPAA